MKKLNPLTELQKNSSLYIQNAHWVKGQRARGESTRTQAGRPYLNKPGMPGWLEERRRRRRRKEKGEEPLGH